MKQYTVTENCKVRLDDQLCELEAGDHILLEGAIIRKVLKVGDGKDARYFIAPSASDNWLIHFVKRLCDKFGCAKNVSVVSANGTRPRSLRAFLDEIVPPPVSRQESPKQPAKQEE